MFVGFGQAWHQIGIVGAKWKEIRKRQKQGAWDGLIRTVINERGNQTPTWCCLV